MITRIVKLTFHPEKTDEFIALFEIMENKISEFEGCRKLSLLKSSVNENIFFTISEWVSENDLNNYRNSAFLSLTGKK
jgi:(4S)-4-hydroxy-5-phosphonooxypentane-2,3-dione isomerase